MKRHQALCTAIVIAAACSDGADDTSVLVGDWGTANVRLVATHDTMTLSTACMAAAFSGPVAIADGHFSAIGTVTYSSLANPGVVHAHLSGITSGANLIIGFYTGDPVDPPPTTALTLTPGGYVTTIGCD